MKRNTRGQSAIEFVISFLVLLAIFGVLFSYVASNYYTVDKNYDYATMEATAERYYTEIKMASQSPSGYVRNFTTTSFSSENYSVSFLNGTAIIVEDTAQNQFIKFLDPSQYFVDGFCEGKNQIISSDSYGVHVCCGECVIENGYFECSTKNASLLDTSWRSCNETSFAYMEQQYRVSCPFDTTSVFVELRNTTLGPAAYSETITTLETVAPPSELWFSDADTIVLTNGTYEFSAECQIASGSITREETINVGGDASQTWNIIFSTGAELYQTIQLSSGEYVSVGDNDASPYMRVVKTNSSGSILWDNAFFGTNLEQEYALAETTNGLMVLDSDSLSLNPLVRFTFLDEFGVHQGNRKYGQGYTFLRTNDIEKNALSETYAALITNASTSPKTLSVLSVDKDANSIWNYTYTSGPVTFATGSDLIPTADGGYVIIGSTTLDFVNLDILVLKIASDGSYEWNKTFRESGWDVGSGILKTSTGYMVSGFTRVSPGFNDVWILSLDDNGDEIWNQTYGSTDDDWIAEGGIMSIVPTADGGYVFAYNTVGSKGSYGGGSASDIVLTKIDGTGSIQWTQTYGFLNEDEVYDITGVTDATGSYYLISGYTSDGATSGDKGWLLKASLDGYV